MANAKKCDRCGAFYDEIINPNLRIEEHNYPFVNYIDLCPQCVEELKQWLNSKNLLKIK